MRPAVCGRGSVVEHHLAKVRVAGSNPVVRSKESLVDGLNRLGIDVRKLALPVLAGCRHVTTIESRTLKLGLPA